MASAARPGLVSFLTIRIPGEARGPFRSAGIILKTIGVLQVALMALTVAMWGLIMLGSLLMWAVVRGMGEPAPWFPWDVGVLVFPVMLGTGFVFLYWNSWVYARWVGRDPHAPAHTLAFGILTILGILTIMLRDPLSMLLVLAKVALAVALLVTSQGAEARAWFRPSSTTPHEWQPVGA